MGLRYRAPPRHYRRTAGGKTGLNFPSNQSIPPFSPPSPNPSHPPLSLSCLSISLFFSFNSLREKSNKSHVVYLWMKDGLSNIISFLLTKQSNNNLPSFTKEIGSITKTKVNEKKNLAKLRGFKKNCKCYVFLKIH